MKTLRADHSESSRETGKPVSKHSFRLLLFNKPMGVLCRFTDNEERARLADYIQVPGVYPVGRLDRNSEGLLLLTDRGALVEPLLKPGNKSKTYLVCVEGEPTEAQLQELRRGPVLKDGPTRPSRVQLLEEAPDWLWPRTPPIRYRKSIPVSWIELSITEGRNRQVRRMTAAVGLPTLRLVRTKFGPFVLSSELQSGQWFEATDEQKDSVLLLESSKPAPRKVGARKRTGARRTQKKKRTKKPRP